MSNEHKYNINILDNISLNNTVATDSSNSNINSDKKDSDMNNSNKLNNNLDLNFEDPKDFEDLDDLDVLDVLDDLDSNDDFKSADKDVYDDSDEYDGDLNEAELDLISSKKKKASKKQKPATVVSELISYIKIIAIAVIIAVVFNNFIIVNAQVPTGSMISTININDRLIGFRLAYTFSEPKRGDIVVFKYPDDESQEFVKRIIGTPGDVVQIKEGHVYVNGEELNEDYINEPMKVNVDEQVYVVPAGHYFMLGDNRNNSLDSRYWNNTYVAKDKIVAKVIFRYYKGNAESKTFSFKNISFSLIK